MDSRLTRSKSVNSLAKDLRVYVLVRQDLSKGQRAVQSGHAIAELVYAQRHCPLIQQWVEQDKTLVLLSATAADLSQMQATCQQLGLATAAFIDSDLGEDVTALAIAPVVLGRAGLSLRRFNLA